MLPEGVKAYIAEWDAEAKMPRIIALEEEQLVLKDGRRGIKANNGLLTALKPGEVVNIGFGLVDDQIDQSEAE